MYKHIKSFHKTAAVFIRSDLVGKVQISFTFSAQLSIYVQHGYGYARPIYSHS